MIKSTHPEFEKLVGGHSVAVDPLLTGFLIDAGVPHEITNGRVELAGNLELLDAEHILTTASKESGQDQETLPSLEIHRVIGSTNDLVMQRLDDQSQLLCTAEMQTAGRGRRGRQWISPFGRNIYLTYGRRMHRPMAELGGLSLVVGMQVVDTLREAGIEGVGLKWPNDVLLDGGKLGGILVELKQFGRREVGVAAGLGLNLRLDAADAQLIDQAFSVPDRSVQLSRNTLIGVLAGKLVNAFSRFEASGFAPFAADWPAYNLYAGHHINVLRGGGEVRTGVDAGIDAQGNLLIETGRGLEVHQSGEVSMRPV